MMVIGLLSASISIPEARSLKDKRGVLRSLKDRTLHKMNVSIAEVGKQDIWKYAEIAFVTIAAELHSNPRLVLTDLHTEIL